MESKIEIMKNLLSGLLEEVEELDNQAKKNGYIPRELCDTCDRKIRNELILHNIEQNSIENFKNWIKEYNIIKIYKNEYSSTQIYSLKSIIKNSKFNKNENAFIYNIYTSGFSKEILKVRGLKSIFDKYNIITCPDFVNEKFDMFIYSEKPAYHTDSIINTIFIGCEKCIQNKKNIRCDSIYKDGFLYKHSCDFKNLLLKRKIKNMGLSYETGEKPPDRIQTSPNTFQIMSYSHENEYYFRDLDIYLNFSNFTWELDTIEHLKPSLLIIIGDETQLPRYLDYETNILFYNENGFFYYDKNKEVDKNINNICEAIIQNLNNEIEKQRGNDHDRVISALNLTGSQLGYVTQLEYSGAGIRLDSVWFDREGKIQVASEVETTGTYKKDLISTWEVEPSLAIIVGFSNTDKVAENLIKLTFMKYIPHHVLYINKITDNAFLFEKQNILKKYKLTKEEEKNKKEIKNI